jgi:hypothetical protein
VRVLPWLEWRQHASKPLQASLLKMLVQVFQMVLRNIRYLELRVSLGLIFRPLYLALKPSE